MEDPKDLEDLTGETVDFILFSAGCLRYRGKVIDGKGIRLKIELPGRIVSVNRYWLCEKGKIHPEAMLYGGSPTPVPVSVAQHPPGGIVTAPFYGGAAVGTAPIPSFYGIEICRFKIGVGSFPDDGTPCVWLGKTATFLR